MSKNKDRKPADATADVLVDVPPVALTREQRIADLAAEIHAWSTKNFPGQTAEEPLLGIVKEFGELVRPILKARQGIRGTEDEHRAAVFDALGDLPIFLLDFCVRAGAALPAFPPPAKFIKPELLSSVHFGRWALGRESYPALITDPDTATRYALWVAVAFARISAVHGRDILDVIEETWRTVRQRNWVVNKQNGAADDVEFQVA